MKQFEIPAQGGVMQASAQGVDILVSMTLNSFVGRANLFDELIAVIVRLDVLKMGPLLALVVAAWTVHPERRSRIIAGMFGVFLALAAARILQIFLPLQPRPVAFLQGFHLPAMMAPSDFASDWVDRSSFPSDTTAVSVGIASVAYLGSRKLGIAALSWATIVAVFPRIYLGLHYLSDVLGGAAIAVLIVWGSSYLLHTKAETLLAVSLKSAHIAAPLGMLFILLIATMFNDVRVMGSFLKDKLASNESTLRIPAQESVSIAAPTSNHR